LKTLTRCVEALLAVETRHAWELVVVDNGSSDGTAEYLASAASTNGNPVVTIVTELRQGKGCAQNAGWRRARGEIIAGTDDDCYVAPDFVDAVISAFAVGVGFVGGRVLLFDQADFPITIVTREAPFEISPYSFVACGDIIGANLAFRREVLESIGGWDERFGGGAPFACEDADVQARAAWAGAGGRFDPRIVVYHHHGRRDRKTVGRLSRWYDYSRGAYYAKMIRAQPSRRTYLRIWKIKTLEDFRAASGLAGKWRVIANLFRELVGFAQYLSSDLWKSQVRQTS
jgi:GT2 family glycosyltransferase